MSGGQRPGQSGKDKHSRLGSSPLSVQIQLQRNLPVVATRIPRMLTASRGEPEVALGKCAAQPGQQDSSRETPFLEIACRLDAGSLPLALLQLCCPASSLAATAAVALGCRAPGTVCPRRFGQFGVGGGFSYFFQCDQATRKRRGREGCIRGPASLHELPNMATHREKLRAIHAADDITDHGCQYPCRS